MNDLEIWEDIEGYDGLYKISNYGRVQSYERVITYIKPNKRVEVRPGRILKTFVSKSNGYVYVNLSINGKQKGYRVHRLVAKAFIPNLNSLPEVNHEDYNKENNHISNLRWCDRFYQNQHSAKKPNRKWQSHRIGKTGVQNPKSKSVIVYYADGRLYGKFESQSLAAIATKSDKSKVSACCLGKRKSHNNLKFKYNEI